MATKIVSVNEFHREQQQKYNLAMKEYHDGERDYPPHHGVYFYENPRTGRDRISGYVLVDGNGSHYAKTKRELVDKLEKKNSTSRKQSNPERSESLVPSRGASNVGISLNRPRTATRRSGRSRRSM